MLVSTELSENTTLSHYRIVSKIGAGGMGKVYLAQDTSELGRMVALKILAAEVAKHKDRLQRFTQEARTVSNLNHPNILTVYEFGQTDSVSFIATEYVEGATLREYLTGRRLKLIDVLDIAIQLVGALNAAHEAGVTHRDLKPENVMVRKDHIVKVLDFGLAKLSEPPAVTGGSSQPESLEEAATKVLVKTEPGLVMGTVSYMSPEQSVGQGVDHRTDIWSAGVVLYEMIAGSIPFPGKDIHRQIIAIQETEPLPLAQQVEGVPPRLEEIILKCLAKEKDERYQTAKDLLIDLRNLRRRLDVDAEIERTVAPALRSTSGGAGASTKGAQINGVATPSAAQVRTTSSAEYILTGIKQHKLAATIVFVITAIGAIGLVYYLHARNTEVAIESIAVLPFENQNRDPDSEYVADGVTEGIINSLTQLPNLKVIARTSVFRYKGKQIDPIAAGKELGVRAILTGRITQRAETITVSTELVDVRDNKQIWGEQYNQKVSDLSALPRDIATKITSNLRLTISGEARNRMLKHYTDNPEAYQLYLKGRYYWNKRNAESLSKAGDYFNQAIVRDPSYALAYSGLADSYMLIPEYGGGSAREFYPKAEAAARKALELDDALAEAHTSLGEVSAYQWKWNEAEKEFLRAIELNPNYATAHQWYSETPLLATGRFEEANREMKRALELDPLSLIINASLGVDYQIERRYDEAIEQLRKTIEMDPTFYYAHWNLGLTYDLKGDFGAAFKEYQEALRLSNDSRVLGLMGRAYASSGQHDEAMKILEQLKERSSREYVDPFAFVQVYAALNDKDAAFQWLEKCHQDHCPYMVVIKVDPTIDDLRSDRRYSDLLRRVGLAQ